MDRNTRGFRELEFVPRVLRDMGNVDTTGTILGREVPFPLILAPTGFTRIAHPPGELAVARAAERAGLPYSLSTMGTRSVEEVAAVSNGSKWFQVYVWRDKGLLKDMILRPPRPASKCCASPWTQPCWAVVSGMCAGASRFLPRWVSTPSSRA